MLLGGLQSIDSEREGGSLTGHESTHWGETFPRSSWFDVRELEPGVHLIGEPGHVALPRGT